jgi:lycopene beta-cyclase
VHGEVLASPPEPSVGPARGADAVSVDPDRYVLVGGGLQNCLITLAVLGARPRSRLTLIEREQRLGGNHTWCFHAGDVPEPARAFIDPLVVRRFAGYDVAFPSYRRHVAEEYCVITSEQLHEVVSARLAASPHARLVTGAAEQVSSHSVTLEGGTRVDGRLIVDARGPERASRHPATGYQKFLGLELRVEPASVPPYPILMDANVEQLDGFRFLYVLPLGLDRVLVEDTYYSDDGYLDERALRERVFAHCRDLGLRVQGVVREERGVLPIPTRGVGPAPSVSPILAGYAGGLFHPTTGYSLPVALRFALLLAEHEDPSERSAALSRFVDRTRTQWRFCIWLNRLLFAAFRPEERRHVLERFYRLPPSTIRRFYALTTTPADRVRILCGRPPTGFSLRRLLSGGSAHE